VKDWWLHHEASPEEDCELGLAPGKRSLTGRLTEVGPDRSSGTGAPGKRTLTARLAPGGRAPLDAVQLRAALGLAERAAGDEAAPEAIRAHAAAGLTGTPGTLPHLDQVQRAFGPDHDLSGLRAHVGGPAAEAAAAIGATAYATGDDLAFAATPDLHTAAHEATHVLQQRAGVQLYGGVGAVDDPYERHADAVADAVVRGESAAPLLAAGPARGGATGAVQRKPGEAPDRPAMSSSEAYLGEHWQEVRAAVRERLIARAERWGHPRLAWGVDATARAELALDGLVPSLYLPGVVARIVPDAESLVTGARVLEAPLSLGTHRWLPTVGVALAREIEVEFATAMNLMAERLVSRSRPKGPPAIGALAPSRFVERIAVDVLDRGRATVRPTEPSRARPAPDRAADHPTLAEREEVLGPARTIDAAPGSELVFAPAPGAQPLDDDPRDGQREILRGAEAGREYVEAAGPGADRELALLRERFDRVDEDGADPQQLAHEGRLAAFSLQLGTLEEKLHQASAALFGANERMASPMALPWVARADGLGNAVEQVAATVASIRRRLADRLAEDLSLGVQHRHLIAAQEELAAKVDRADIAALSANITETLRAVEGAAPILAAVHTMVLVLATTIASAGIGHAVSAALMASLARTALQGAALSAANLGASALGVVVEAAIGAALQEAIFGDDGGEAFAENLLASILSRGVARGMARVGAVAGDAGAATRGALRGLAVAEEGLGIGAGLVAERAVRDDSSFDPTSLEAQTVIAALGRSIGGRLGHARARLATLDHPEAVALQRHLDELTARLTQPMERPELVRTINDSRDALVATERLARESRSRPGDLTASAPDGSPAAPGGDAQPPTGAKPPTGPKQRPFQPSEPTPLMATPDNPTVTLLGIDDNLRQAARFIPPMAGHVDVVVHGKVDSFVVMRAGKTIHLDQRAFARYLRKQGLAGQPVRLIACDSGFHPAGIAQQLANQLGVAVWAPTKKVWIHEGVMGVGDAPGVHNGGWAQHQPGEQRPRVQPVDELELDRRARPDDGDVDRPIAVMPQVFDRRARVTPEHVADLAQTLDAPVVIDPTLDDGVSVQVRRRLALVGFDLDVTEIRVGANALVGDVLAHAQTVANVQRYNGVLGKLRQLWHRVRGVAPGGNPHQRGTRSWATHEELTKLDRLQSERHADFGKGLIDQRTLDDEIAFLEGRRDYHEETLRAAAELRGDDRDLQVDGPDTGAVTREALAKGYRLPGEEEGVKADWYYYRNAPGRPGEYHLAINPNKAPADAPAMRAVVVNQQFAGIEPGEPSRPAVKVPVDLSPAEVVEHLRDTPGFGPYAKMLEQHQLASKEAIDSVIGHVRGRKQSAGAELTFDDLRRDVKQHFRERVVAKLTDPALSSQDSYRQMRTMLDDLAPADRGNLAEAWYHGRFASDADRHVAVNVPRTGGENAGKTERRVVDMVQGETAVEVKDVAGKIDANQFEAYLDLLKIQEEGGDVGITKLKYVFTKPEGAVANLERMAAAMTDPEVAGRLAVEVFTSSGDTLRASTAADARRLLQHLKDVQ
jgi:hypothetical protein